MPEERDPDKTVFRHSGGHRYHMLGLVITDPEIMRRVRNVMYSCTLIIALLLAKTMFEVTHGESAIQSFIALAVASFLPFVGYSGAKKGSPGLICMFCALSLVSSSHATALLIMLTLLVLTGQEVCEDQSGPGAPTTCHAVPLSFTLAVFAIGLALWAVVAFWASYNGSRLYAKLTESGSIAAVEEGATTALEFASVENPKPVTVFGKPKVTRKNPVAGSQAHVQLEEDEDGFDADFDLERVHKPRGAKSQ